MTTSFSIMDTSKYVSRSARFYLVDVVEDVVALVHLNGKELALYKQNVRRIFGFVNVTKHPSRFHGVFAFFDVRQLHVHQTHGNDGEGLLGFLFVRLLDFVASRWNV